MERSLIWWVAVLAGACLLAVAAGVPPGRGQCAGYRLDFGDRASPVEAGYLQVTPDTAYTPARGYGWTRGFGLVARDRYAPPGALRDFVYAPSRQPSELRLDLPDGRYRVVVRVGDVQAGDHRLDVAAQGRPVISDLHPQAGQLAEATFVAQVAGTGSLLLTFSSKSGNWILNALEVSPAGPGEELYQPSIKLSALPVPKAMQRPVLKPTPIRRTLRVIKPARYSSRAYPTEMDYMRILERFPAYAERGWHRVEGWGKPLGYFGDPDHGEMGMRAMGNFILVYAFLATDPRYDPRASGVHRARVREHALQCLRYMLATHVTGGHVRPTGLPWGHYWQSAWWTAKMAAGARLLWPYLTAADKQSLQRVVADEADRHLGRTPPSGLVGDTKAEENAWDCEVMAWACSLYPRHPNAARWRAKLTEFAMNSLSVRQDREGRRIVDGKPVRDWVITENVYPDFTIENHGAYHTCYMTCPLHSLAMCYLAGSWPAPGETGPAAGPPQAVLHHYVDVWRNVRRSFLYQNRFAYMGGKDWPRYTYGTYWVMPALALLQHLGVDAADARAMERGRVATFEREQVLNGDGSFYGRRYTRNLFGDRWAEYETDTYALLAISVLIHRLDRRAPRPTPMPWLQRSLAGTWLSPSCQFAVARGPRAFVSIGWHTLAQDRPVGLFVPAGGDDLVEWSGNQLVGSMALEGYPASRTVTHEERKCPGGFTSHARILEGVSGHSHAVERHWAMAAIADAGLAVVVDRAVAARDLIVRSQTGLALSIPNDVFNRNVRVLTTAGRAMRVLGVEPGKPLRRQPLNGRWVNVDDRLGVVRLDDGPAGFVLRNAGDRTQQPTDAWRSLLVERLCCPDVTTPSQVRAGQTVRDTVFLLASATRAQTRDLARTCRVMRTDAPDVRLVAIQRFGKRYIVAANLSSRSATCRVPPEAGPGAPAVLSLAPGVVLVLPVRAQHAR